MIDPTCDHWSQNMNIFKLNINTIFPYSSSFDPVSRPPNQLPKNTFFYIIFLARIRPFCEKWIILIHHSPYGNFVEAGNWQNPLCWIRTTSQVARGLKKPKGFQKRPLSRRWENRLLATWEVVRIQQSGFCEFPASRKFPYGEWLIKMIHFSQNGQIQN